jgi:two-component system nitrate/nitrite response regulator NarL
VTGVYRSKKLSLYMLVLGNRIFTSGAPLNVLVADSSERWREQVERLFDRIPEIRILAFESNGADAIKQTSDFKPDLLLTGMFLPDLNGIAVARCIQNLGIITRVLIVCTETDPEIIDYALSHGASGFVYKLDFGYEIIRAIDAVLLGESYVSTGIRRSS